LDHNLLVRIQVIQTAIRFVLWNMHPAVHIDFLPFGRMALQLWPVAQLRPLELPQGRARRSPPQMLAENDASKARMQWGSLIRAIATDQDRAAFATLFEYFAPRIKSFLQRSGASEASAEELAQETMLAVWRKAALFDPESAGAAAWIFTIARNLRIDAHRRDSRGGGIETSDVEIEFQIDDSPLPDSRLASAQSEERVRSALSQLSADQVRVIELSFFEEKAHADIAKILEIPLGTVKSRLRLAMSRLRKLLLSELS
jgi:RNA polymerase sigma-70 factor (ECF subfamily)